jgi:hypothetical protein
LRSAEKNQTLSGHEIKAGGDVVVELGPVRFDPKAFSEPKKFNADRKVDYFSAVARRLVATTQSCIPSRMTLGLSRSRSPTAIQIRKAALVCIYSVPCSLPWMSRPLKIMIAIVAGTACEVLRCGFAMRGTILGDEERRPDCRAHFAP